MNRFIPNPFRSIQARLLLSFLLSALLALMLVLTFNQWIRIQLLEEADSSLISTALGAANRIDEFNRQNLRAYEMAAALPTLVEFMEATEERRADQSYRQHTLQTLGSLQIQPWDQFYALSIALINSDGLNLLDTISGYVGQNEGYNRYFQQTILTGIPTTSNVYFNRTYGNIYYFYSMPIRRQEPPNPVIGLLRVQIAVSTLQEIVFETAQQNDDPITILLFDNNLVRIADTHSKDSLFRSIASLSPSDVRRLTTEELLPPLPIDQSVQPLPELAQALTSVNKPTIVNSPITPDDATTYRIAIIPLDSIPWYLVVGTTSEAFYAPIQRQSLGIVALSIAMMIVAVIAAILISRSVTRPILQLTQAARQVAAGNLEVKTQIKSRDEIGELSNAFNQMTAELHHIKSNLEDLVAERTQKLSQTNEALKHEITERQRYEKQAFDLALEQERIQILSNFIQDASHEFRTPLAIINLKTHLLRRIFGESAETHITTIEQQSQNIEKFVNEMVLMSRLDSDMDTPLIPTQLDSLITSIHQGEMESFAQNEVSFKLDLHGGHTHVDIHADLMHTAMSCILENACKFTPAGGEVSIETHVKRDIVRIRVSDNGTGISEQALPHVFERFYRADEAHTTRGFGLGLPIAKRIIEHFHGTIDIASQSGRGTSVLITLPISHQTYPLVSLKSTKPVEV